MKRNLQYCLFQFYHFIYFYQFNFCLLRQPYK